MSGLCRKEGALKGRRQNKRFMLAALAKFSIKMETPCQGAGRVLWSRVAWLSAPSGLKPQNPRAYPPWQSTQVLGGFLAWGLLRRKGRKKEFALRKIIKSGVSFIGADLNLYYRFFILQGP
jgi:hypothetical protein